MIANYLISPTYEEYSRKVFKSLYEMLILLIGLFYECSKDPLLSSMARILAENIQVIKENIA